MLAVGVIGLVLGLIQMATRRARARRPTARSRTTGAGRVVPGRRIQGAPRASLSLPFSDPDCRISLRVLSSAVPPTAEPSRPST